MRCEAELVSSTTVERCRRSAMFIATSTCASESDEKIKTFVCLEHVELLFDEYAEQICSNGHPVQLIQVKPL